jgi:hypothetical protein
MNDDVRFERLLDDLLTTTAPPRAPVRIRLDVASQTSAARQLPRWLALIKEPPMRVSSRVAVGSPTFRLVSILALTLALVLATAAAIATGASLLPTRVPDAYGPARNGSMAYEVDGDIYLADATGDHGRPIINGPTTDRSPGFSHDGTRLLFGRGEDADLAAMVANADGSAVTQLFTGPVWAEFMPSDTQMVTTRTVDGRLVMSIVDLDGVGTIRDLDLGGIGPQGWVMPRPPDGEELIFTGRPHPGNTDLGIYAIKPDGTGLRAIGSISTSESDPTAPGATRISFQDPALSPDGSTIAYWNWDTVAGHAYTHLRDLDTGEDRLLPRDATSDAEVVARFSPDSSVLLFERQSPSQLFVAPVDASRPPVPMGPTFDYSEPHAFDFSPDGTKVILTLGSPGVTSIMDVTSGESQQTTQPMPNFPGWQRLAP